MSLPPWIGMVVALPSLCRHRSWLPVCRARSNPSLAAIRLSSDARALGMYDFGGVARQRMAARAVLFLDQTEDVGEFTDRLFGSWHQSVAARNCRNLRDPAVGLVPVDYDLVIVNGHVVILLWRPPVSKFAEDGNCGKGLARRTEQSGIAGVPTSPSRSDGGTAFLVSCVSRNRSPP